MHFYKFKWDEILKVQNFKGNECEIWKLGFALSRTLSLPVFINESYEAVLVYVW